MSTGQIIARVILVLGLVLCVRETWRLGVKNGLWGAEKPMEHTVEGTVVETHWSYDADNQPRFHATVAYDHPVAGPQELRLMEVLLHKDKEGSWAEGDTMPLTVWSDHPSWTIVADGSLGTGRFLMVSGITWGLWVLLFFVLRSTVGLSGPASDRGSDPVQAKASEAASDRIRRALEDQDAD